MFQGLAAVSLLPSEHSRLQYILLTHSGLLLFPKEVSVHQMPSPVAVGSQAPSSEILAVLPPAYEYRVHLFLKINVTYQTQLYKLILL
jgi:hypothetical protein